MSREIDRIPNRDKQTGMQRFKMLQCALCGQYVRHGAVIGKEVDIAFKATVDLDGTVWVPSVHGYDQSGKPLPIERGGCPEPPPSTSSFWNDVVQREAYKKDERERRMRARSNAS